MARTEIFRKQHKELLDLAGQMKSWLDPGKLARDAAAVMPLLSQLAGKLKIHLAAEDNGLYPQLTAHPNAAVKGKAKQFQDEMGGILKVFSGYTAKYPTARAIQSAAPAFVKETLGLFEVLAKRIKAEDNDLYPLLDSLS